VTTNWFPENERAFATMAGTSSNISGILIGFAVPALFIDDYKDGTKYTPEELHDYSVEVT
jgi:hypothetical protein